MPCDSLPPNIYFGLPGGSSGSAIRLISLWVAKSTTANPLKPESWASIHFVDPSLFVVNAIGRIPSSISRDHSGVSVFAEITVIVLDAIDPETTHLPSGVTYVL